MHNIVENTNQTSGRLYTDIVGPVNVASLGKFRYFVTILEKAAGDSLIRFLNLRGKAAVAVIEMVQETKNLSNNKVSTLISINRDLVKWIRSDEGGEYLRIAFQYWLKQKRIGHGVTTPDSPESNGTAKHLNRTLIDISITMMIAAGSTTQNLWARAVNTACFLGNRLVSKRCKSGQKV